MKRLCCAVALVFISALTAMAGSKEKGGKGEGLAVGKMLETIEGDIGCRTADQLGGYLQLLLEYNKAGGDTPYNQGYYGGRLRQYSGECSFLTEGIEAKIVKIKDLRKDEGSIFKQTKAVLVKLPTGMTTFVPR